MVSRRTPAHRECNEPAHWDILLNFTNLATYHTAPRTHLGASLISSGSVLMYRYREIMVTTL